MNKVSAPKAQKGWLSRWTRKQWSRHWFVLKNGSLTYYRGPAAELCSFLDGVLDLSLIKHIQVTPMTGNESQHHSPAPLVCHQQLIPQQQQHQQQQQHSGAHFSFTLKMWNGECHLLAASSAQERTLWLEAINSCTNGDVDDDAATDSASSSDSSPTSASLSAKARHADIGLASLRQYHSQLQVASQQQRDSATAQKAEQLSLDQLAFNVKSAAIKRREKQELRLVELSATLESASLRVKKQSGKESVVVERVDNRKLEAQHEIYLHHQASQLQTCAHSVPAGEEQQQHQQQQQLLALSSSGSSEKEHQNQAYKRRLVCFNQDPPTSQVSDKVEKLVKEEKDASAAVVAASSIGEPKIIARCRNSTTLPTTTTNDNKCQPDDLMLLMPAPTTLSGPSTTCAIKKMHQNPQESLNHNNPAPSAQQLKLLPAESSDCDFEPEKLKCDNDVEESAVSESEDSSSSSSDNENEDQDSINDSSDNEEQPSGSRQVEAKNLVTAQPQQHKKRVTFDLSLSSLHQLTSSSGSDSDSSLSSSSSTSSPATSDSDDEPIIEMDPKLQVSDAKAEADQVSRASSYSEELVGETDCGAICGDSIIVDEQVDQVRMEDEQQQQREQLERQLDEAQSNVGALERKLSSSYANYSQLEQSYERLKLEMSSAAELHRCELERVQVKVDELNRELLETREKLINYEAQLNSSEPSNAEKSNEEPKEASVLEKNQYYHKSGALFWPTGKQTSLANDSQVAQQVAALQQHQHEHHHHHHHQPLFLMHNVKQHTVALKQQQILGTKLLNQSRQIQRKLNQLELKMDKINHAN